MRKINLLSFAARLTIFAISSLVAVATIAAETSASATPPPATAAPAHSDAHEAHVAAKITSVTAPLDMTNGAANAKATASLGTEITVSFAQKDTDAFAKLLGEATDDKPLTLYLNCLPMKLAPIAICYDKDQKPVEARFVLARTTDNDKQWHALLRTLADHEVNVAVGLTGEPKNAIKAGKLQLQIVADWLGFWIALVITVLLVLLIFVYGASTNLLRDLSPHEESQFQQTSRLAGYFGLSPRNAEGLKRPPFSLGRVQMAFWFALVATSYLFLWLVLGEQNSFNTTALTLLGISLGTGLISRTIDASKTSAAGDLQADRQKLEARQTVLTNIAEARRTEEQRTELATIQGRLAEIKRQIDEQTVTPAQHVSEGFLTDILSDENGVSLHRLQMAGWTLILGLVFVAGVRNNLTMPIFDNTLLGLMGISSGAFLGFKVPEKKSVPAAPAT